MKYLTLSLVVPPFIIATLFGDFWWVFPNSSWGDGLVCVVFLWAFAFNNMPTKGLKCLEDKFNMRFVLPLAILSSIGFLSGFIILQN